MVPDLRSATLKARAAITLSMVKSSAHAADAKPRMPTSRPKGAAARRGSRIFFKCRLSIHAPAPEGILTGVGRLSVPLLEEAPRHGPRRRLRLRRRLLPALARIIGASDPLAAAIIVVVAGPAEEATEEAAVLVALSLIGVSVVARDQLILRVGDLAIGTAAEMLDKRATGIRNGIAAETEETVLISAGGVQ